MIYSLRVFFFNLKLRKIDKLAQHIKDKITITSKESLELHKKYINDCCEDIVRNYMTNVFLTDPIFLLEAKIAINQKKEKLNKFLDLILNDYIITKSPHLLESGSYRESPRLVLPYPSKVLNA